MSNLYKHVPLLSALEIIINNAKQGVTTVIEGPTGCGKTYILENNLRERFPKHRVVLFNMAGVQPGDLTMPAFVEENGHKVFTAVPRKELGMHWDEDIILILDEMFKCPKSMQVELGELLYKRTFAGKTLSPDSIIVGASNLGIEGFGDSVPGFVADRISRVRVRGADGETWVDDFALPQGLHPTIIQAAKEYPAMFAHFDDYSKPGENPYIFDPRQPQDGFVTLRGLAYGSKLLYANEGRPVEEVTHVLGRKLGMRAAADIMAVHELHAELPEWSDIMKDPEKTQVPKSAGACCLLIYTAIQRIDKKSVLPWMKYLQRFKKEAQALFVSSILRVPTASKIVSTEKAFLDWAMKNQYLYQQA